MDFKFSDFWNFKINFFSNWREPMMSKWRFIFLTLTLTFTLNVFANKTVVIVGGGIAGVSAAAFLKDSDYQVHLFEKEAELGGNAQTLNIPSPNPDQQIAVDMGPQYFANEGWEAYTDLLRSFGQYSEGGKTAFSSSITVHEPARGETHLVTAKWGDWGNIFNMRNMGANWDLYKFMGAAYDIYQNPQAHQNLKVGDFLQNLDVPQPFKDKVLRPLIASVGNARPEQTDDLSILAVAQGMAFRHPTKSSYNVSNLGMGKHIQLMAENLQKAWPEFKVHTSSPVSSIEKVGNQYLVKTANGKEVLADEVLVASHADQAAKFLKETQGCEAIIPLLESLEYAPSTIAIHRDASYIPEGQNASFYNIKLLPNGDFASTMNLQTIHPRFNNIFKSWIKSQDELDILRAKGMLLGVTEFYHPVVTTQFLQTLANLKRESEGSHISFMGAWTTLFETHDTAVRAAFGAVSKLLPSCQVNNWLKKLPSLRIKKFCPGGPL